jgi:RNA polymerase sigma-70 factor, ECF subfamily
MDTSLSIGEAYERFSADLRRFVTSRSRDVATSEDIVHEAFVRLAIESRERPGPTNPRAWLYRVALNLVISGSRHSDVARRRAGQLTRDDVADSPEDLFLASESHRALGSALQTLGPHGRTSLLLAAQGYTGREIAQIIGRSEGATRTLMCRARGILRGELTRPEGTLAS